MIENRPDWVVSRQRAWGVPIAVFVNSEDRRGAEGRGGQRAHRRGLSRGGRRRLVRRRRQGALPRQFLSTPAEWEKVDDILDVWFDSGSTHAFVLEERPDLKWPASLYLEGSDQHRGWFHSSLLESCGTRGRAPYDAVLTHGFVMAEDGRKMSKSLGNQVTPQQVIEQSGADILRLWVVSSDYAEDLRIGPEILKTNVDSYRKLRNTIRWMLGSLAHFRPEHRVPRGGDAGARAADAVGARAARRRRARGLRGVRLQAHLLRALHLHDRRSLGLLLRHPQGPALLRSGVVEGAACGADGDRPAVRLPGALARADDPLHLRGGVDRAARRRRGTRAPRALSRSAGGLARRRARSEVGARSTGSAASCSARSRKCAWRRRSARRSRRRPSLFVSDPELLAALDGVDMAEVAITSGFEVLPLRTRRRQTPSACQREGRGRRRSSAAAGRKCARSWKYSEEVGSDPDYPDVTPRDAAALREYRRRPPGRRIGDGDDARASSASRRPSLALVDRPGAQGLDARPLRHRGEGPRGADAVPRPRPGLEPRRQLRPLHAGRRSRPLAADRARAWPARLLFGWWLWSTRGLLAALSLGLVIGGALPT